jgi:phenylalanyl-tRNA synthetase beta chain
MRFSFNFIKEILDIDLDPRELAQKLTMAGMEVEGLEQLGNDWVFDIEITTNRYDWLSVVGVAREMAAAAGKKLVLKYPKLVKTPKYSERKIIIEEPKDCPFYVARLIKNISIAPSDKNLRSHVVNSGINSINNIVDITNYSMMKWGNPLHAFDADKIEGDIQVRRAKKGEKFIGIDNKEYELTFENLVIADNKKIIALAGVMGAKNSEVAESTKNVLLEAAIFNPLTIRKSRRAVGLDTDSSYRFERRVSADCLEYACAEAGTMIAATNNVSISSYVQAGKKDTRKLKSITISLAKLNHYIGQVVPAASVKKILQNLDCTVKTQGKDKIVVTASPFRFDLEREVDLYEEVLRIYGFDKIRPELPFAARQYNQTLQKELTGVLRRQNDEYNLRKEIEDILPVCGFKQIVTFSLESSEELSKAGYGDLVKLANPLRAQENALRPSLILGMVRATKHNLSHGQEELAFFEIADIYQVIDGKLSERAAVSLGVCAKCDKNFVYLKGAVKTLLAKLAVEGAAFYEEKTLSCANALAITAKGKKLGFLGKLDKATAALAGVKEDIFYAQLDLAALEEAKGLKRYAAVSYFPGICRDLSIVIGAQRNFSEIEKAITVQAGEFLNRLEVVDRYKGNDLPTGSNAVTLRVWYQAQDRTLTAAEVDTLHMRLREELIKIPQISLR